MGSKGSKAKADTSAATTIAAASSSDNKPSSTPEEQTLTPAQKYRQFRDELLNFSLGESAYDYAERIYSTTPDSPEVMALLAETTTLYDKTKNKVQRDHWVDRMDLLQRGIDISRKCIKDNPDYGPCYRSYVMCATRASESIYYYRLLQAVGLMENYSAIIKRGEQGMTLMPDDAEIPHSLGALSMRCAYPWYSPYRVLGRVYSVPKKSVVISEGVRYLKLAAERDPNSLEIATRLGMAYFHANDFPNARRWYCKVRDEMVPLDLKDDKWKAMAHTQLSTGFSKNRWNVPFA